MTYVIKSNEVVDTICLAIYDKQNELLREVNENDLVFPVAFNKSKITRLYLMGELLYNNYITITVSTNSEYNVKILAGKEFTRYSDFSDKTNSTKLNYNSINYKLLNAVPIDILIESKSLSLVDVDIELNLKVEDSI